LTDRLKFDDIVLQRSRLRWYGQVLWQDESEWVTKCVHYVVEGARPRSRPKTAWKEVVEGIRKVWRWLRKMHWSAVNEKNNQG